MKAERIGLVLGGGGTKGAYQFGALLALKKHGLLNRVKAVAATSIGAINLLLLLNDRLEHGIDLWKHFDRSDVLSKRKIRELLNVKNFGIYSRSGLNNLLNQYVDFTAVKNSPITAFVTATKKGSNEATYFALNGQPEETILSYVLASSAIPMVYPPEVIAGEKYVDGGKVDNEPFQPLLDLDLDLLILIPLNNRYQIRAEVLAKAPVIDLGSHIFDHVSVKEGLNMSTADAQERLDQGFTDTDKLMKQLIQDGVLNLKKKGKVVTTEHRVYKINQ